MSYRLEHHSIFQGQFFHFLTVHRNGEIEDNILDPAAILPFFHFCCINGSADFLFEGSGEVRIFDHGGDDIRHHLIQFRLLNIDAENTRIACGCDRILAIVVIPGLFVLGVVWRDTLTIPYKGSALLLFLLLSKV